MRFFFYGTLIAGNANPVARAIHALLQPLGPATLAGDLYAIPDPDGWFPIFTSGDGTVHGELYAAGPAFAANHLAMLDRYEECDPASPETCAYLRKAQKVRDAGGGAVEVQVYCWSRPVPAGAVRIAGGRFGEWVRLAGVVPFGGRSGR